MTRSTKPVAAGAARAELEAHLTAAMAALFARVPFAREFHAGQATDRDYYVRHMLEAVVRITLNNEADAYCLHRMALPHPQVAQTLATYLAEEYGHDELLLQDLKMFGVSPAAARQLRPFFATRLLMGYLYYSINRDGALPVLLWNWFVEWYSAKYNRQITYKAQQEFGPDKVKSTLAHLQIDDELEHSSRLFSALEPLLASPSGLALAKEYLTELVELVGMYFQELHEATIGRRPRNEHAS